MRCLLPRTALSAGSLLIALLAAPLGGGFAKQGPIQVLSVSQPAETYVTSRDGCDRQDVPDEPARAFRDAAGTIHFFATHSTNRAMLGKSFNDLRHSCDIAFDSRLNAEPSAYEDNEWLTAFWAEGNTVQALIHNELHGNERKDYCPLNGGRNCIEVSITAAFSHDGGYHFHRFPGERALVAELPYPFRPKRGSFAGYANPSNIVKFGGYFYFLVSQIDPYNRAHNGVCLLRTQTVNDPQSWRAWGGLGFTKTFADPYTGTADPEANTCTPITKDFFTLGSVGWSPARNSFLLVTRVQRWDQAKSGKPAGAYLWESSDLIHWRDPTLLLSDAMAGGQDQLYPSLIDPNAADQNFTTIGNSALLFTMVNTPSEGYSSWKLLKRRVTLR